MSGDSLSYLFSLERFGIKFGLDNIRTLVDALGRPDRTFRSLHVAGTNGKGSVTAMVDTALRAARYRTGRYTSPHLVDITERFAIDGVPVSRDALADAITELRTTIDRLLDTGALRAQPTFFEATTAIAFELFRRARVEVAVCEVGLGGRLDATNVIEPTATAITSIGFDHQQYLGHTLAAIAREKAGIIKPGVPVVIGPMAPDAQDAIADVARTRHAPLIDAMEGSVTQHDAARQDRVAFRTPTHDYGDIALGLAGHHQIANALVAVRLLEAATVEGLHVPPDAIVTGLSDVKWPGRLERRRLPGGREMLLDAAHNPAGAEALAVFLREQYPERPPLVFAAMSDKDIDGVLHALVPVVGGLVMTSTSNARSADPHALAEQARAIDTRLAIRVEPALRAALAAAWSIAPRIIVAGSVFLVGDVMKELDRA